MDERDEMLAQMESLLADCRPWVARLEALQKRYPAASAAEDLAAERAEVRGRLQPMVAELHSRRKSFQSANRNWLYLGAVRSVPKGIRSTRTDKAHRDVGTFMVYQSAEKRVRSFVESATSLLVRDDEDFGALAARLETQGAQGRMRSLKIAAAGALAAGLCVWGLLGLFKRRSPAV